MFIRIAHDPQRRRSASSGLRCRAELICAPSARKAQACTSDGWGGWSDSMGVSHPWAVPFGIICLVLSAIYLLFVFA
jgi:hypothetical protein